MPKLILANESNVLDIINIINDAKAYLKKQGSRQWNLPDGYPNESTIVNDIKRKECYIYIEDNIIIGSMVIMEAIDENYNEIKGKILEATARAGREEPPVFFGGNKERRGRRGELSLPYVRYNRGRREPRAAASCKIRCS